MLHFSIALVLGICLAFGGTPMLAAQDTTTYEGGALRIESLRGDARVVRGADGALVGKIGIFRGIDVPNLVASSQKAAAEARKFVHDYKPGVLVLSIGVATTGLALGVSTIQDVSPLIKVGLTLSGIALVAYGAGRLEDAYNALERSVWWYNRDLKH
jgi:hypothetical protein